MEISQKSLVKLAKIVHEANRAFCQTTGDFSHLPWDETDPNLKATTVNGILKIVDNPTITDEDLHNNWIRCKAEDGWTYGPVKDPVNKTHPCMVPYNELSVKDRFKDALFANIVRTYLSFVKLP